jgi:hypothetical protein
MKNIFNQSDTIELINRIEKLTPESKPKWGKMAVAQMLAHCNVAYEFVYDGKHIKPKGFKKWLLKTFVKNIVVSDKPYKKNNRTAPEFLITSDKDFNIEKNRLIAYIRKTQELGSAYFDNKESHSFGKLTESEWNNMFSKHLDHHLNQFGV